MDLPTLYRSYTFSGWIGIICLFIWVTGCSTGPDKSKSQCQNGVQKPCIPIDEPHPKLTDYNLYQGAMKELDPVEALIPYNLSTTLFSDYAQKFRMIYVPDGKSVAYDESEILNFPVGSVLVKNFFYDLDRQDDSDKRRIIETRLLMYYERGWEAETYLWNDAQTSATLERTGDVKKVSWIDKEGIEQNINYVIPTKNDCKTCHSYNDDLLPLGPKVRNMNKEYSYAKGKQNQLQLLQQAGILTGLPPAADIPKAPDWDDPSTGTVEERARIYLDVNCSNCHREAGVAGYSGHFLTFEEENPTQLGICKNPIASGGGSGGLDYDIVPCRPDKSILVFRMNAVDPDKRMPEI